MLFCVYITSTSISCYCRKLNKRAVAYLDIESTLAGVEVGVSLPVKILKHLNARLYDSIGQLSASI